MQLVCVLGNVRAVGPDGGIVEIASASQRRLLGLLGLLALHTPQRLRTEWLADVLEISPGALRRSVSRLRTVLGSDTLVTATTGYALTCPVDAVLFCDQVARAADATDRIAALERAVGIWGGAALEEFEGEDWARGEIARLTHFYSGPATRTGGMTTTKSKCCVSKRVTALREAREAYRREIAHIYPGGDYQ